MQLFTAKGGYEVIICLYSWARGQDARPPIQGQAVCTPLDVNRFGDSLSRHHTVGGPRGVRQPRAVYHGGELRRVRGSPAGGLKRVLREFPGRNLGRDGRSRRVCISGEAERMSLYIWSCTDQVLLHDDLPLPRFIVSHFYFGHPIIIAIVYICRSCLEKKSLPNSRCYSSGG